MCIEPLEGRVAPARLFPLNGLPIGHDHSTVAGGVALGGRLHIVAGSVANDGNELALIAATPTVTLGDGGKSATFTDVDGDFVTVRTSVGVFDQNDFSLVATGGLIDGARLELINLSDDNGEFSGANITISAKRTVAGGNGQVNIGYLDATGVDLGKVSVAGDLAQIDAGDGDPVKPGLLSLTVQSIGALGLTTQGAGGSLESDVAGAINKLIVNGDLHGATIFASGIGAGKINSIVVGGSVLGGALHATETIGKTKILGNLNNGAIIASDNASIGAVNIGGSLSDRAEIRAGQGAIEKIAIAGSVGEGVRIIAGTTLGPVTVKGAIAGTMTNPVLISAFGKADAPAAGPDLAIKSLNVRGPVERLRLLAGYDVDGNALNADAAIGPISVGGDWSASTVLAGATNGFDKIEGPTVRDNQNIFSSIASIVIKGQTFGTTADGDDFAIVAEEIKKATIATSTKLPFVRGPRTPTDLFFVAPTGPGATGNPSDFAIFELGT